MQHNAGGFARILSTALYRLNPALVKLVDNMAEHHHTIHYSSADLSALPRSTLRSTHELTLCNWITYQYPRHTHGNLTASMCGLYLLTSNLAGR